MSYIISSPFVKICISEQNCTFKHLKFQPRIIECEINEHVDSKASCPILTFAVDTMNELCIDIDFTDKDKTSLFSVDKHVYCTGSEEPEVMEEYSEHEEITGVSKISQKILIPNKKVFRGSIVDHGLIIWIDKKPIGIFCRLPDVKQQEQTKASINIFDASISIARVLLLSDESTQSRVLLSSDENMQSKILLLEIKNKIILEDMIQLIAKLLLRIEKIEEKIENKCCSSSEK